MNKELLEKDSGVEDSQELNNYQRYLGLGGIINEGVYNSAMEIAKDTTTFNEKLKDGSPLGAGLRSHIQQAKNMASFAGIELSTTEAHVDPRVVLYHILREDVRPVKEEQPHDQKSEKPTSIYVDGISSDSNETKEKPERHHDEMSDQQIFVEGLRMLGDAESVDKMIKAYPQISFKYQSGGDN